MGNNRFKLSDMMPNAWFYKLKDMSKAKKWKHSHAMKNKVSSPTATSQSSKPRYSHYFSISESSRAGKFYSPPTNTKELDLPFIESPRRSSTRRASRKSMYKPSPTVLYSSASANYSCRSTSNWTKPDRIQSPDYDVSSVESSLESDLHEYVSSQSECESFAVPDLFNGIDSNCSCRVSSSTNDIIIDMNSDSFTRNCDMGDGFDTLSQFDLPPILTKPVKFDDEVNEATEIRSRIQREAKTSPVARKSSANSNGIRLRINSPKLASRKVQAHARRSVCKASGSSGSPEGFAVVKSSVDPKRDFKESMVEMIVENNIRAMKDLEDLLACYLSLNSREYHGLIVKAFEEIWFDMPQLRM